MRAELLLKRDFGKNELLLKTARFLCFRIINKVKDNMELKTFVENVCCDVLGAMKTVKELGHGVKIDSCIEFDLAVTSEKSVEGGASVKILDCLGFRGRRNSNDLSSNRVRFSIFLSSETIEEQEKKRTNMGRLIDGRSLIR